MNATTTTTTTTTTTRGVEVRPKPAGYSAVVDTLFACTGGSAAMGAVLEDDDREGRRRWRRRRALDDGRGAGIAPSRGGRAAAGGDAGFARRSSSSPSLATTAGAARQADGSVDIRGGRTGYDAAPMGISQVAAYVAAGGALPLGRQRHVEMEGGIVGEGGGNFGPCPTIPPEMLLSEHCWDSPSFLARSMLYHASGFCETTYVEDGGPFERLGTIIPADGESVRGGEAPRSPLECIKLIEELANSESPLYARDKEGVDGDAARITPEEIFEAHLLQLLGVAISPVMGRVEEASGQKLSEMLIDVVINLVSTVMRPGADIAEHFGC